jgi:hypothetical protein
LVKAANPITAGVVKAAQRRDLPFSLVSAGTDPAALVDAVNLARSHRPEILMVTGGRATDDGTVPDLVDALRRRLPELFFSVSATTRASFAVHSTRDEVDRLIDGLGTVRDVFA